VRRLVATMNRPFIPQRVVEAVRDEVGSQLCRWTSFGKRVCEVLPDGVCLCRDVARAALAVVDSSTTDEKPK
jgi:hypothetical protein